MPRNVMCKNCNNLVNQWCERVIDSPDEDMVRDCAYFWQRTNADRIRAMTDNELANFMAERTVNESTLLRLDKDHGLTAVQIEAIKHNVYCAFRQWLQQPAEGDA